MHDYGDKLCPCSQAAAASFLLPIAFVCRSLPHVTDLHAAFVDAIHSIRESAVCQPSVAVLPITSSLSLSPVLLLLFFRLSPADWGLRSVKSVLRVAGALKRGDPDIDEEGILMRALRDFNTPKMPTADLPIFLRLIQVRSLQLLP